MEQRRSAHAPSGTRPSLGPRAERVLKALGTDWRSAGEIAARLGVSVRTINRDLSDLVEDGSVDSVGEARARRYACAKPRGLNREG